MAGFLDRQERVLDVVLTEEGRRQLASGQLKFSGFAFFDDGIDYDPWIYGSGSLDSAALSSSIDEQIFYTPALEAVVGLSASMMHAMGRTELDGSFPLMTKVFTMPQGKLTLPWMSLATETSGTLDVAQRQNKLVKVSYDGWSDAETIEKSVDSEYEHASDGSFPVEVQTSDGFVSGDKHRVRVYLVGSGSDHVIEMQPKRDDLERISYYDDLILEVKKGDR